MVRFSRSRTWPAFLLPRQSHREGGHEGPADGRRRQELLNLLGLAGENLGDQVVGHRTLVAGEAGEKLGPHGAGDGHRCQAQTRRPAIGRFVQPGAGLIDASVASSCRASSLVKARLSGPISRNRPSSGEWIRLGRRVAVPPL